MLSHSGGEVVTALLGALIAKWENGDGRPGVCLGRFRCLTGRQWAAEQLLIRAMQHAGQRIDVSDGAPNACRIAEDPSFDQAHPPRYEQPVPVRKEVPAFICRHAAQAVQPGEHVASVLPWYAAPHIVDFAVGHDTDIHDTDICGEDPTVAPPVPGRWRSAAKIG
jgi:hypothetical protein